MAELLTMTGISGLLTRRHVDHSSRGEGFNAPEAFQFTVRNTP
jgi:hypothetical protein